MRHQISWSDLRDRKVGLWGLGVEGLASLRRLQLIGASIVLVDDHPSTQELDGLKVLSTLEDGLQALKSCSVVVKSPGISRYRADVLEVEESGIDVVGGLGLWMQEAKREKVACITGTKGKSTTTAIASHLLNRLGYRCLISGNFGQPPWDPLVGDDYDFWLVETSSFQASDLSCSPPIVAITSLFPDHLDWHGSADQYFCDKLSICSQPGADLTIADGSNQLLRDREQLLGHNIQWIEVDQFSPQNAWADSLGLNGVHNLRNALIARAILVALKVPEASSQELLSEAAKGFSPLPSRCRLIGSKGNVDFIDDSLSTNVLPALAAIDTFSERSLALLVGGYERGIDYRPLGESLRKRNIPTLVVTLPDNGPRIGQEILACSPRNVEVKDLPSLSSGVRAAYVWARTQPDAVVLLSPAAPSFGRFENYRDRSDAFARAMQDCVYPDTT